MRTFHLLSILSLPCLLPSPAQAEPRYCASKRLDWSICQQEIRDHQRDPRRPCPAVPPECHRGSDNGNSDSEACASARLDWSICVQQARSAGEDEAACGPEPSCW